MTSTYKTDNENNIAFLIPTYPPHYKYTKLLIKSHIKNFLNQQSDIWLIFTDESEKAEFGNYSNCIVLPENLRNFENRGIINIKKFYGLSQIKNRYKYIIILDAESKFIRNINLLDVCETYFENKILYGNFQTSDGIELSERIKNSCRRYFLGHEDLQKLNSQLYLWFNQLCIYKTSTLNDFFEVIKYKQNEALFANLDFDYYIYMFYLILYHDFEIEDAEVVSKFGFTEGGGGLTFRSNKYKNLNIYMSSLKTYKIFDNPKLFCLVHLDRNKHKSIVRRFLSKLKRVILIAHKS